MAEEVEVEAVVDLTKAEKIIAEINAGTSKRVEDGILKAGIASAGDIVKGFEDALATDASLTDTASRQEIQTELQRAQKDLAELNAKRAAQVVDGQTRADEIQKEIDAANRPIFAGMYESLASGFNELGSSIKSDFTILAGPLNALQATPGMKTIITILKLIGMWIAKIGLKFITGKLGFGGLAAKTDAGNLDVKKTLANFGKWAKGAVGAGEKIDRKTGDPKVKSGRLQVELGPETADKSGMLDPGGAKKAGGKKGLAGAPGADEEKTFKGEVGAYYNQMTESWADMKGAMSKKFADMKNKATDMISSAGTAIKKWAGNTLKAAWKLVKDTKVYKLFAAAGKAVASTFMKMTKALWGYVKKMIIPIAAFIVAGLMMVATMVMSAIAMMIPFIPIMLIIAGIVLLVIGLVWLGKKIVENWDRIKESFSMAMEQLSIWGAKGVAFIGNMFKSIWLSIKGFFITVFQAIENGINAAIAGINELIPGEKWDISPVDLGAGDMKAEFEAEEVAFEQKKQQEGEEMAAREGALADRRAAYDAAGAEQPSGGDTNQQNVVVNQSTTKKQVTTKTQPTDVYGSQLALAQ